MKLSPELRISIRDKSKSVIKNIPSFSYPRNSRNEWLTRLYSITKNFLQKNKDLILTRADKGNVTVALGRTDYINKVQQLLGDENTYTIIKKDPTKKLISSLRELLSRWKNHGYISNAIYKSLLFTDGTLPRAYSLPKIHKTNIPFRLIVSSINSPLYSLALFLHKVMIKNFPIAPSHINNSFDLVHKLADIHIDDDSVLISLDVTSLFTNIPVDLALSSVSSRWRFIQNTCGLPEFEFLNAVRLVLNSTFFTFNNMFYKQTFGTPMGSPISPIIADIVLQDLEEKALNTLRFTPRFYFRYVDDILMTVPTDSIDSTLSIFNSFHDRLQFTCELEVDRKINFLDVTIIVNNNVLIFDWFHKSTFSGRYLNYFSQHPLCQKKGTIIGLVDRVSSLSHPTFHYKNLDLVVRILLDNGYPLSLVFQVMNQRLRFLINGRVHNDHSASNDSSTFFTVPYLPGVTEQFRDVTNNLNVKLAYTSLNKLNKFIKVHKDYIPTNCKTNVVYKINCSDCDASYVGQTSRMLKTRISEHRSHINKNLVTRSVITNHRLQGDHDFRWNDVQVLDETSFYNKRLISEMLFIKRQKNGLNLQTDTESLPSLYHDIINKLPKI
ncbi:uncharacterized protein LOC112637212 [Camponotus floridanus]|uniref:uncharacterized protein LOC112637212 n=1 Tax=Camponotus floridanus TaxID=104421 RepID=UPI000DC6C42B|nr:uncharacterized protein LOC112637212 [Camponotus floridanus]